MDTELIKNIITIIPSIVALLVTIITLFANRTKKVKESTDSKLRIINLKRYPFEEDEYKKLEEYRLSEMVYGLLYTQLFSSCYLPTLMTSEYL